jgi:ankyrin repeat protein
MSGDDSFARALNGGNKDQVAVSIASGTVDVNVPISVSGGFRSPPIVLAAGRGYSEIVEMLLNAGALINACDDRGRTACLVAAQHVHVETVLLLISRGADVSITERVGSHSSSALSYVTALGNEMLARALIEAGAATGADEICQAAAMSTRMILYLLERGLDVGSCRVADGRTPCHAVALRSDNALSLALLVTRAGVDVNAQDDQGRTCCHICASTFFVNSLRQLIELEADLDRVDRSGRTSLHHSCQRGGHRCSLLLLAAGADVEVKDKGGRTACHFAAGQLLHDTNTKGLANVLAAGADFDSPSNSGLTPRQVALKHGVEHPSAAELTAAARRLAIARLEFVRERAFQVCVGLQSLCLDALQTCEILLHACGRVAPLVPFHNLWRIATTVKHFRR